MIGESHFSTSAINEGASTTLRKRFTPSEDMLLKAIAAKGTMMSWDEVAKHLPGRTGRQCRDRYNNYLNKLVLHKAWTHEEDQVIIEKYKQFGPRWTVISSFLQARSGNNVKNRWYKYIIKRFSNITTAAPMPRKKKTENIQPQTQEIRSEPIKFDKDFSFDEFSPMDDDEGWSLI